MKFVLLFLFVPVISFAQVDSLLYGVLPMKQGKVSYTATLKVNGASKSELFLKVENIMMEVYKPQRLALMAADKETGYLGYKGSLPLDIVRKNGVFGSRYQPDLYYTLKVYIEDETVKVLLTDLSISAYDAGARDEPVPIEKWKLSPDGSDVSEKYSPQKKEAANQINEQVQTFFGNAFGLLKKKND